MKRVISLCLAVVLCLLLAVPAMAYGPVTIEMYGSIFFMYEAEDRGVRQVGANPFGVETVRVIGVKSGSNVGYGGQEGFAMPPAFTRVDYQSGEGMPMNNATGCTSPLTAEVSECTVDELFRSCGITKGTALVFRAGIEVIMLQLDGASLPDAMPKTAYMQKQTITIDSKKVELTTYALKDINGGLTNYVRIRDIAQLMNSTNAPFNVTWDGAVNLVSGTPYVSNGTEFSVPFTGDRSYTFPAAPTKVNGEENFLSAITLTDDNGGGYTYYKLRDLGNALGFVVDWTAETGIFINT